MDQEFLCFGISMIVVDYWLIALQFHKTESFSFQMS